MIQMFGRDPGDGTATGDVDAEPPTLRSFYHASLWAMDTLGVKEFCAEDFFGRSAVRLPRSRQELGRRVCLALRGCQLIVTDSGMIGLASSAPLTVGDEVWVISGCPLPVILRATTNQSHVLVGQVWISKLMNGCALSGTDEFAVGSAKPETRLVTLV